MNYCYEDILKNRQKDYISVEYGISNIFAIMDIGKERKTQQDGILILQHPIYSFVKLIAVADGMGGLEDGEIACNLALLQLSKWFLQNFRYDSNINLIKKNIYNLLENIDLFIRNNCNGGTTLALSIILDDYTLFFNIGDSRIYIQTNNKFYQLSKDHSITWNLYNSGIIKEKDHIRFHKNSNLLLSRLGCKKKLLEVDFKILNNYDYDNIYLFTDGITDCLSDFQIFNIIQNNSDNKILRNLINASNNMITYNKSLLTDEYYDRIIGGKDNMSAIVYKKK